MPIATVDKDGLLSGLKYDVGRARKEAAMEPIPVSEAMQQSANDQFRTRITSPDSLHDSPSYLGGSGVGHGANRATLGRWETFWAG